MKYLASILFLGALACSTPGPAHASYPAAQSIVEKVASKHADLVRLSIIAIPHGESRSRFVASTSPAKLDHWSDPEDVQAMETKQPSVKMEGANLDYTSPVLGASGTVVAVVGVTVKGANDAAMLASAKQIAGEVSADILAADKPLW